MALIPTGAAPVDYRRKIAMELMQQGMDGAPVKHWTQGLAKLGQGAMGGYEMYQADQKDKADDVEGAKAYLALLQAQNAPAAAAPQAAPAPSPAPVPPQSPAVPMAAPMGNKVVDALSPPPVTGPRPNGPVMPSAKVWGDQEAEAAGLYEPAAPNTKLASANPSAPIVPTPVQSAPVSPVAQALAQQPQAVPQVMAQADDPNRAKIVQLLQSESPAARKMGKALADNYITSQFKPESTDDIKEYNLAKKQGFTGSFFDYKTGVKKAGKPETTINNTVNPILKGVGDRFNEGMEVAKASIPQIQGIHEARRALDQGAITGAAADPKLFLAKAGGLFGLGGKEAANTEVLRSSIGNSVLAKAKTLGANPSNADRDYIEKVVGGSIALEENSIRRLLDMQEKWARDAIRRANKDGQKMLESQPDELKGVSGLLSVEEPDDYATWSKKNPITAPQAAPPTAPQINNLKKKYGLD